MDPKVYLTTAAGPMEPIGACLLATEAKPPITGVLKRHDKLRLAQLAASNGTATGTSFEAGVG